MTDISLQEPLLSNPSPPAWWESQDPTGRGVPSYESRPGEGKWFQGSFLLRPLPWLSKAPCQTQTCVLIHLSVMKKEESTNVVFRIVRRFTPKVHTWRLTKERTQVETLILFCWMGNFKSIRIVILFKIYFHSFMSNFKMGPFYQFNLSLDILEHFLADFSLSARC